MSDITKYKSHPDKLLITHIDGVINNVRKHTDSDIAETAAMFHDLGKMNPNFQAKLEGETSRGYSNHSLLSAYAFYCMVLANSSQSLTQNEVIGIIVLIAKHHGNLPDFCPSGDLAYILPRNEIKEMFSFLEGNDNLPMCDYVRHYIQTNDFESFIKNKKVQECFGERLSFNPKKNESPLRFFLSLQSAFANLIQADKADAAKFDSFVEDDKNKIRKFSNIFCSKLESHLQQLNQDTELNKLRTEIREEAILNVNKGLSNNENVFELTSPTGSGKTLMLLSLASEIIKQKGAKRIIYSLPFLSITEQVEKEVLKIFEGYEEYIQRIDSKSVDSQFEKLQDDLESFSDEDAINKLNSLEFKEATFSYPLIITTFVRFFETLLSNRNSELLKLPNFSNCIFLLDEIQALPPRLYGFFVAYLTKFCKLTNSYAVISTATQPNFDLPDYDQSIKTFFDDYKKPFPLLPLTYFENELFNRYEINYGNNPIELHQLKERIINEDKSVLVILNTIDDTKDFYDELLDVYDNDALILLNTHFTPDDRKIKIEVAKERLRNKERVIIISTQLIEAGVDIDFPIVYRDFTTVASVVQSAGRCNRNGKMKDKGKVVVFRLKNRDKIRYDLIYRGKDKVWIEYTQNSISETHYQEKNLLTVQKNFFNQIQSKSLFGVYGNDLQNNFINDIKECMFEKIGRFKLIDEEFYGEQKRYYVPENNNDNNFEVLLNKQSELVESLKNNSSISIVKEKKKDIEIHLKKMSNRIVQIRLKKNQNGPLSVSEPYFDLYKISQEDYSFEKGINMNGNFIL
ncbi:MAG: CRISPR-associated helicase Cas3' [Paludibacteraceae bacterium]|nr:CRISPR-associated helicase Cas3' [Paludibacteraceae bacterium]